MVFTVWIFLFVIFEVSTKALRYNTITYNSYNHSEIPVLKSSYLGNVVAVISDRKSPVDLASNNTIDYYLPHILTTTDYYSFGSPMPGRKYAGSSNYRYGFNGKENDNETVSTGEGTQDYGFRIYNPALGRFLSVDPLTKKFTELTPYQFASNSPIMAIDFDGLEANIAIVRKVSGTDNKGQTLANGRVIPTGDIQGNTYMVGNTVQPNQRNGTVIQILNVEINSPREGVYDNHVTLIADVPIPIVSSTPNSGTIYTGGLSAQSVADGSEIVNVNNIMSSWTSNGLLPGEGLNSVSVDLGNVKALTGKQLNTFKRNIQNAIRTQLNNSGSTNVPIYFNTSATKSSAATDNYVISFNSTVNTFNTTNVPNVLSNLGFNANFINSVMQTINNVLSNTPQNPADANVKTTNNPTTDEK